MARPRFAVDKMLGRLATWLRLIGQDATYGSHLSGRTLVRQARTEGRTILTRDRRLMREALTLPIVFIESDNFHAQLSQVIATFNLHPFTALFTRCARCNVPVVSVPKEDVIDQVPEYVCATQERFVRCPRCRRIYWPGTHYDRVREQLQALGYQPPAVSNA